MYVFVWRTSNFVIYFAKLVNVINQSVSNCIIKSSNIFRVVSLISSRMVSNRLEKSCNNGKHISTFEPDAVINVISLIFIMWSESNCITASMFVFTIFARISFNVVPRFFVIWREIPILSVSWILI